MRDEAPGWPVRAEAGRRRNARLRSFAPGDGRMPRPGFGPIGGLARPHLGASGAVLVHLSPRSPVGARIGGGFGRVGGGLGARDGIARTRPVAADALGIERSGDSPSVGVGGKGNAWFRLQVPGALELASAPRCGSPRGGASGAPRFPTGASCGQHADTAAHRPPFGTSLFELRAFRATRAGPRSPGRAGTNSSNSFTAPTCR